MSLSDPAFPDYKQVVSAGGLLFLSGVRPAPELTGFADLPAEAQGKCQGFDVIDQPEGLATAQSWSLLERMGRVLAAAGSSHEHILRQHIWQQEKRWFPCFEAARMHWQPRPSPSSGLGVRAIAGIGGRGYGSDAIAVAPDAGGLFTARTTLAAPDHKDLPSASHYAQAVQSGPLVFTAGFIAIATSVPGQPLINGFGDLPPEGRTLATGRSHPDSRDGPIAAQTWFILNEIRRVLAGQGLAMADVVHASVFLADLRDTPTFHRVYRQFFPAAEATLCITGFDEVGHRGCRIEIEVTALRPESGLIRRNLPWPGRPPFAAPLAVRVGPLVYFSGLLGLEQPSANVALESHDPSLVLATQSRRALGQLVAAAAAAGARLAKCTVYLDDLASLPVWETVRRDMIPEPDFAFEAVVVHGPGPVPNARIQIEAIGVASEGEWIQNDGVTHPCKTPSRRKGISQPDADCGELDGGEVVGGVLLVAGGDGAVVLEPVEEALDEVPVAIQERAERGRVEPVAASA